MNTTITQKENGIGILKDQTQLQELKMEITDKKQGTFEMATLKRIHSYEDVEKLSPDLLELLKKEFPVYFESEKKENNGRYPEHGDQEMKDRSFAEYKQIESICRFARLALFSRTYDLLDDEIGSLKLEDGESKYGRNFVYSLQDMIRRYIERMEGLKKRKGLELSKKETIERIKKRLMKRVGTKLIGNEELTNLLELKGDDDESEEE